MARSAAEIVVDIVANTADAVPGFDRAADAAEAMADRIGRAANDVVDAGGRMARAADGADTLASKAGQATGALGALSSGFELVGMEKYANGLVAASMATDFFSGVGDALNLVLDTQIFTTVKARAATIAKAAAERAAAAASKVATAAQWAWNAAVSANPIGLLVLAVVAVVAALVLAYKKSDRFRAIVDKAMAVARKGIAKVVDWITRLVKWVKDKAGPAFERVRKIVAKVFGIIGRLIGAYLRTSVKVWGKVFDTIRRVWGKVTDAVARAKERITDIAGRLRDGVVDRVVKIREKATDVWNTIREKFRAAKDKLVSAAEAMRSALANKFNALLSPVQSMIDKVKKLIDWIKSIRLPDLSDLNPLGRLAGRPAATTPGDTTTPTGAVPSSVYNVTVNGALDPAAVGRQIDTLLSRRARRLTGAPAGVL